MATDQEVRNILDLMKRVEIWVKSGRIPYNEAKSVLENLENQYLILNEADHIIDLDAKPFILTRWSVKEIDQLASRVRGQFKYDHIGAKLHLSKNQQNGKIIWGHELRKELETQPVLNANLLDFYLVYPELIPEEWKGKLVFFWGTIYRDSDDFLCVRCLRWRGDRWDWSRHHIDSDWSSSYPAVLLAQSTP